MMSNLINLHAYWMLNGAIAFSYVIATFILKLSMLNKKLSQLQQLQFTRKVFIITLLIFLIVPFVIAMLPLHQNNAFQFQPILKHASAAFLQRHVALNSQVEVLQYAFSLPSIITVFSLLILMGSIIILIKYIKDILALRKLTKNAYCHRKINNIHILFSETTTIPFCWSSINSHFVIIPSIFLEKNADLKLAIRHELQHIRQGDTYWLHFIAVIKIIFFWNPLMKAWSHWFSELQEFACDESLILNKKTSRPSYAQCLIDTASTTLSETALPQGALGIIWLSKNYRSMLNRRVTMLFDYKNLQKKKISLICAYATCFLTAGSLAYALDNSSANQPMNIKELSTIVNKSHLQITITPEILSEINNIRGSKQARSFMITSLERMKKYKPYIETQLKNNAMPNQLLALPFVESGYNVKATSAMLATGIWQFIPSTAKNFDLTVNSQRDDRLDTQLSTQAAISYLKALYSQFHDWKLAIIAYEIGEKNTEQLINTVQSHDAWVLARSPSAPKDLKKFLSMFEASVIIMNNPELVTKQS